MYCEYVRTKYSGSDGKSEAPAVVARACASRSVALFVGCLLQTQHKQHKQVKHAVGASHPPHSPCASFAVVSGRSLKNIFGSHAPKRAGYRR